MKTSITITAVLVILLLAIFSCEAIFFPKTTVVVRHVHLEPTGGQWHQKQVWTEVYQKSAHGDWEHDWKEEWANVKVPGNKWE